MTGQVIIGGSFYHTIAYCLEDKRELSTEQKKQLSALDNLRHMDRAEVLEYNNCYGDKWELTEQFRDVRKLNKQVEKPVIHLMLRAAPGDRLTRDQWVSIAQAAAREFEIDRNQYICVLHHDTDQQHIHIVGNRVGYDGKVAKDSHSYARMAKLNRQLEKEYNLQKVLSPRRFLSPKDRQIPRHDKRKERLKENIRQTLLGCRSYAEFEKKIQEKSYRVDKGRGIAFEDDKKVRVKGSEVGYSLATIERILAQNQRAQLRQSPAFRQQNKNNQIQVRQTIAKAMRRTLLQAFYQPEQRDLPSAVAHGLAKLIHDLLKPEHSQAGMGHDPWEEEERRRKKKKKRVHR